MVVNNESYEKTARPSWWSGLLRCFHPDIDRDGHYIRIAEEKLTARTSTDTKSKLANDGATDASHIIEEADRILLFLNDIKRRSDTCVSSAQSLLQAGTIWRLSDSDRSRYLSGAAQLLCLGFPSHWHNDQGHQIATWPKSESCFQHVERLVALIKIHGLVSIDEEVYSDLLLRSAWYLYEREVYSDARAFVTMALGIILDAPTTSYASAADLSGLLSLDLVDAKAALLMFDKALEVRRLICQPHDPFMAYSLNNIALAHTELGNLERAFEAHNTAISIRLQNAPDRIGNSYSNLASLLLCMGNPDEAERTLAKCPSLKDFTDETFLATGNPRFSGDMVLLSRIRRAQGRLDEALRLASKALAFRRQLLGSRLKTCDSLNDVASLLQAQGNTGAAAGFWKELVAIAEALPEGKGQLARAKWRLGGLEQEKGRDKEAEVLRREAMVLRDELRPDWAGREDDASYEGLCLWMLW